MSLQDTFQRSAVLCDCHSTVVVSLGYLHTNCFRQLRTLCKHLHAFRRTNACASQCRTTPHSSHRPTISNTMTSGNLFVPFLGDLQQKQRLKESLLSILDSCVATSDPAPTKQTPERPTISPLTPASTIDQSTSPAAQFLGPHHALRPAAQSSTNTPDLASPIPHATPLAPTSKVKKQPSTRLQLQPHDTCFTALKGVGKVLYVFDPNDIGERLCERTGLFKVMNRVEKTRSRARYDDSSSYPQSFSKKNVLETKPRVLFCACTKCTNGKKPVRAVCESFEVMCNKTLRLVSLPSRCFMSSLRD